MLESIGQVFVSLELEYLEQFTVALLPMSLTVVIHGYGMKFAGRYFRRFGLPARGASRRHPGVLVAIMPAAVVQKTHSIES